MKVKVFRDQTCFGPGDQISVRIVVLSNRVSPVKLKSVSVSLRETITFRGSAGKTKSKASQRSDSIAQKNKSVGKKIYKGDSQIYDLVISVPKTHQLMSIATAKHLDVSYMCVCYTAWTCPS